MNRNESSRLSDLQAEGNLGNEKHRDSGRGREKMRNRSSEGNMRDRSRREGEAIESSEEWNPSDVDDDLGDNNDAGRGGSER
jgi:hypothetical protein